MPPVPVPDPRVGCRRSPELREVVPLRTYSPKPGDVERRWLVVDASGVVLGRLASQVAQLLRGKHKPQFAPHADVGDFVVVVNAAEVVMTGGKAERTDFIRHSGYPGGLKRTSYADLLATRPEMVVEQAVRGMLPHTRLGRAQVKKLKVYRGPEHPHAAQQPQAYDIRQVAQPV